MIPDDPAMPLITRAEVHGHDTCPTGTFSTFLGVYCLRENNNHNVI
jgi:hypothetical protein